MPLMQKGRSWRAKIKSQYTGRNFFASSPANTANKSAFAICCRGGDWTASARQSTTARRIVRTPGGH